MDDKKTLECDGHSLLLNAVRACKRAPAGRDAARLLLSLGYTGRLGSVRQWMKRSRVMQCSLASESGSILTLMAFEVLTGAPVEEVDHY